MFRFTSGTRVRIRIGTRFRVRVRVRLTCRLFHGVGGTPRRKTCVFGLCGLLVCRLLPAVVGLLDVNELTEGGIAELA